LSSLFDAPVQLMLLLAAVVAGQDPAQVPPAEAAGAATAATGPYSFSEAVWLNAVREGLGGEAVAPFRGRIFKTSGGRVYIPVQSESREILAARQNPALAQAVARDLARFNATQVRERLGRPAGVKDLYAAHMFGLDAAARLAGLAVTKPKTLVSIALSDVASSFPEAALWRGASVTVASLYERLPDGQEFAVPVAVSSLENALPVVQAPSPADASHKKSVFLDVQRTAPLRGIIKEADGVGAGIANAASNARVADLDWATEVRRTP
jgi:hypothetical protein